MQGPSITFDGVSLELSGAGILRDVSFTIGAGEIHCLIGPNGGGKTSLARCLLGQMPHTGTIEAAWGGSRVTGYVPQSLDFDKTLPVTVDDFMTLVCERRRPAFFGMKAATSERVAAVLARVGLGAAKRRTKLGSLSGGERQRVLFAQALTPDPALLVLDEPMTSMDETGAKVFADLIRELAAGGTTIVWIAHELAQVAAMADAVTCVNRTLLFSGPPGEVLTARPQGSFFEAAGAAP